MPESEITNGGNGDDEEHKIRNEDGEGGERRLEEKRRREDSGKGVFSISRDFRNAIKRSFSRKKKKKRRRKERADGEIKRSSSSLTAAARTGRRSEGCYVCFLQPGTEENPDTPTSDPNSKSFSFGSLRKLIQRNDFYSEECNPHI
ncbi:hypothetical protein QQ045_000753 [Rhodiola kirilowii]